MKRIFLLSALLFCGMDQLLAQVVDASPEIQTVCNGASATLTATVTAPGGVGAPGSLPTDSYAITSVPYTPDPLTAGTAVSLTDDSQTGLIPIGFTFCYFGNTYTNFIIGSNNWVGFQTGETSTWVTAPIPQPSSAIAPRNTIMGPWQDINPGAGGTVKYALYGVAPFRRLSVSWNNVPMYSCTSQLYSSQITIYETSNIIETHILNKPICSTWNSGNAVHGLHNSTGTVAFVVPGRNNTAWTTTNEGTRFTPNGAATYTINWYIMPSNTLVGTGSPITVTPPVGQDSTYYYAEVVGPNGCGTGTSRDTVLVIQDFVNPNAGPYTSICQGTSTILNASGGSTYSWSPATGLSSSTGASPTASPLSTVTYTLTATSSLGCVGTDTVTVGVNPAPFADAGSGAGICNGDAIGLSGNGTGTYSWSPAASLDNATIATPLASPTSTTTYTLTVTDGIGCTSSDTASVWIFVVPANAGPDVSYCVGGSTTLNASGGVSYSWLPAMGLSSTSIPNPVASPAATTTYTVMVTDVNGCSKADSVKITVYTLPTVDAGAFAGICSGNNTTLGASGGTTFAWSPTSSLSDPTIFNPVASPTTTTTYSVTITDASGCVSNDTVTVQVNALPIIDAGTHTNVCLGASTTLSGSGGSTYSWAPAGSLSNPSIANPVATPMTSTTYTVTGTNTHGCVSTDTVSVDPMTASITPSAGTTICAGSSTTLSVSGASTYVWSPAATLSSPTISNPVATPTGPTTYTVIGTASTGCADTAYVSVMINALPVVNGGAALSICSGSTANLSASGASTYVWTPAASLDNAFIPTPISSATVPTTYTVTGTDLNGCQNTDTVSVIVHPIPTAGAGSNTSICLGTSTTLTGSGGGTYSWTPGAGLSSTTVASPVATPITTTTYTVTVTGSGGCTGTAQVTITVNPVPTATAGSDVSICNGASTILTATGGGSYSWSPSTGLSSTTVANPTASPASTQTYVVTVSNAVGCIDKDTVVVNVSNALTIAPSTTTPETCTNSDGTITVGTITGGVSPYTYSLDGGAGQSSSTFTGLSAGTHTITVTDVNGCFSTTSATITTISNVVAGFTATPTSGSKPLNVDFTNTSTGATTYFWDLGNGNTSTAATPPTQTYGTAGTYTVTLTVSNGGSPCIDITTITIDVFDDVTIIVPNVFTPNGDGVNDVFRIQSNGVSSVDGTIFDRWGKKITTWSGDANSGWDGTVNGKKADDGTYFYVLKVTGGDKKEYDKQGYVQLIHK